MFEDDPRGHRRQRLRERRYTRYARSHDARTAILELLEGRRALTAEQLRRGMDGAWDVEQVRYHLGVLGRAGLVVSGDGDDPVYRFA